MKNSSFLPTISWRKRIHHFLYRKDDRQHARILWWVWVIGGVCSPILLTFFGGLLELNELSIHSSSTIVYTLGVMLCVVFLTCLGVPMLLITSYRIRHPMGFSNRHFWRGLSLISAAAMTQTVVALFFADEFRVETLKIISQIPEMFSLLSQFIVHDPISFSRLLLVLLLTSVSSSFFATPYFFFAGCLILLGIWPVAGAMLIIPIFTWDFFCFFFVPWVFNKLAERKISTKKSMLTFGGILFGIWAVTSILVVVFVRWPQETHLKKVVAERCSQYASSENSMIRSGDMWFTKPQKLLVVMDMMKDSDIIMNLVFKVGTETMYAYPGLETFALDESDRSLNNVLSTSTIWTKRGAADDLLSDEKVFGLNVSVNQGDAIIDGIQLVGKRLDGRPAVWGDYYAFYEKYDYTLRMFQLNAQQTKYVAPQMYSDCYPN